MRVTIIADDGKVGVDGVFRAVNLSTLSANIHAVQWGGAIGHVEFKDRRPEQQITDISPYQSFIDAWTAAVPPPPTLAELKVAKAADFISEGVTRIAAQVPDWDSLDTIKTVAGLWVPHLVANATPAQIKARNLYLYIRNTVPARLNAVTTQAELDAIDPSAPYPFATARPGRLDSTGLLKWLFQEPGTLLMKLSHRIRRILVLVHLAYVISKRIYKREER